jgi:hypothetical protein
MRARPVLSAVQGNPTLEKRFWAKVRRAGPSECWLWTATISKWGYGGIKIGKAVFMAHRVSFAMANQQEPGDMLVCHSCDTPACVNPAHLWLGSDRDNHRDMMAKGRWRGNGVKGERHMWTKLTAEQVLYIKTSPELGYRIAEKFGVAKSTVSAIRKGHNWNWLSAQVAA